MAYLYIVIWRCPMSSKDRVCVLHNSSMKGLNYYGHDKQNLVFQHNSCAPTTAPSATHVVMNILARHISICVETIVQNHKNYSHVRVGFDIYLGSGESSINFTACLQMTVIFRCCLYNVNNCYWNYIYSPTMCPRHNDRLMIWII